MAGCSENEEPGNWEGGRNKTFLALSVWLVTGSSSGFSPVSLRGRGPLWHASGNKASPAEPSPCCRFFFDQGIKGLRNSGSVDWLGIRASDAFIWVPQFGALNVEGSDPVVRSRVAYHCRTLSLG